MRRCIACKQTVAQAGPFAEHTKSHELGEAVRIPSARQMRRTNLVVVPKKNPLYRGTSTEKLCGRWQLKS